ncbi:conserved repeat domain-containing protein [Loktanella fryxellensis]|uniref:Conserved repeat domain-containing protein n=1 Tax=Loktanella fryxellensis TaxID=245187 RepID=A0A1H8IZX3_9RHOB|nr:DUF11 domain-containing protein [Loktanella fryxellensis]SEN73467.1 conserved repeat domain-containing protein [Loktanella fryxellensis]
MTADADQQPALTITKRIRPGTAATFDAPGDLSDPVNPNNLVFDFIVRNAGNVTTTDPITVSDSLIQPAPLTCTEAPLAPGDQVICSLPYAPTQANVDAGLFANSATAATQFGGDSVTTPVPGTVTAIAVRRPGLAVVKSLVSLASFSPGQIATYRYDLTNNGNTTITGPITVDDDKIPGPIACGAASLAPGGTTSCTATYRIAVRDVQFGSVTNSATGTNGTVTSDPTSLTIPPGAAPTLSITKTPQVASFSTAGEVIPYTFVVTNTSAGTAPPAFVEPVVIVDDKITTPISCPIVDGDNPLEPTDSITCTGSYTVTQADVDALRPGATSGFVINNAFARSSFAEEDVLSPVVQARVDAVANPALTVAKTAVNQTNPGLPAAADDVILFTIVARNTGSQTLQGVTITDPFVGTLSCDVAAPVTLAPPSGATPGDALTCTGTYTVTQDDVDAGAAIANTAGVDATTLQGTPVTGGDSTTYPVAEPTPAMTVTKTLIPSGSLTDYTTAGETLSFGIAVANTGNITLNDISVTDSLVPGTCDIATLAPGETDATCVFALVVTQADIDRGTIDNTATATALPANPGAAPLTETGVESLTGPDRLPRIGLSKTGSGEVTAGDGSPTFNVAGQTLNYVYTVANIGNVTLNRLPAISDDRIPSVICDPLPAGGLMPSQTLECRGTDVVDQVDLNAGFVTNNATATMANEYGGDPLTAAASETITAMVEPDVSISKVPSVTTDVTAGTEVTYTYTVQNPGNVTLNDIALVDFHTSATGLQQLPLTDGGRIASLQPGEEAVLTATYTVTQDDIDSGNAVRNTVNLSSTLTGGGAGPTDTARARVDLARPAPAMTAIKTVPSLPATLVAGTDIAFEIALTNTGNVTLTEPDLTDDVRRIGGTTVVATPAVTLSSGDTGAPGVFEVGEARIYAVTYTLTQADIDAGGVTNSVTAAANDLLGNPVTDVSDNGAGDGDDPTVVPVQAAGAIDVVKVVQTQPDPVIPGGVVTFEISVANTGNVTLTAPILTEDLRRADGTPITPQPEPVFVAASDANTNGTLDLAEVWRWTVEHTLTQDDIDAGGLTNSVTAATTDPSGTAIEDVSDNGDDADGNTTDDPAVFAVVPAPALDVTKVVAESGSAVGDTVIFRITAVNTGNVTLSDPVLTDDFTRFDGSTITGRVPVLTGAGAAGDPLAPLATRVWTLTHVLTQADVDAGGLRNTATLSAVAPGGAAVSDVSDNGDDGDGNTVDDSTDLPIAGNSGLEIVKQVTTAGVMAGDPVVFTLTATNTGTLSLSNVTLTDTFTRADGVAITGAMPVPASPATVNDPMLPTQTRVWTLTHTLTQADIDAGGLRNTALASGTAPNGSTVTDVSDDGDDGDGNATDDPTELLIAPAPLLDVTKVVSRGGSEVGDSVAFTITATNVGNVTLTNPVVVDTLTDQLGNARATADPVFVAGTSETTIQVGASNRYTVTYVLTQADIDAGGLRNTATVSAESAAGAPVSDVSDNGDDTDGNTTDDPTDLSVALAASLSAVKQIVAGPVTVGGRVIFDIRVTNTGNVTLRQVAIASDTLTRADGTALTLTNGPVLRSTDQGSVAGTLAVGETGIWRASYVLTQADIDAGGISNIAVATGTPLTGNPVTAQTRDTDEADGNPATDPTELIVPINPALVVDKVLSAGGPTFNAVGQTLSFRFDVRNTGNVRLVDGIAIDDPLITDAGGTVSCPAGPLAPGAAISCTADYAVTQADIDAGGVTNTATATSGAVSSAPDAVTVPASQSPALTTVKTAVSISTGGQTFTQIEPQYFQIGAVVAYDYVVTNTGNTTVTAPITVTDNQNPVSCPAIPDGLAPQAAITCTATYTVDGNDVALGSVTNVASASDGATTSPLVSETVPQGGMPALELDKALIAIANPDGSPQTDLQFNQIGDELTYRFTVTNTGNAAYARDVVVDDALLAAPLVCFDSQNSTVNLASMDSSVCDAIYVVTQSDLDRASILNEAVAATIFGPDGNTTTVSSRPAQVLTPAAALSALTLTKSATVLPINGAGQVLTYTLTVENTGNQTLTSIAVSDPLLPALTCEQGRLAPQGVLTCDGPYTVTQADIDAGTLVNTATVTATTPQGAARTATDTLTLDTPAPANDLQLTKAASVAAFGRVGSTLTFDLIVTNNGNLTLTDLVLTDPAIDPAYSCTVASLAPGASDSTCTVARTVTQADVDAGILTNTAFVTGRDARGNPVTAEGSASVPSQPRTSALDVTKVLTQTGANVGDTVTFEITALNAGDVTLRDLAIADTFTRLDGSEIVTQAPVLVGPGAATDPLNPGDVRVWTLDHVLTQDDLDAGGLRNSATVSGVDPADAPVSDVSDNGNDADGNVVDDATLLPLIAGPAIDLEKRLTTSGAVAGDTVVFTITATNVGNVSLSDLTLTDTFTRADGTAIVGTTPMPSDPATVDDPLRPGQSRLWTLTYALTQADIDAGGLANTASITATDPAGDPAGDVSDNGIDDDGNTTNDPTLLPISGAPGLNVTMVVATPGTAVGDTVTYEISVTNTGNVTLMGLVVTDTMTALDGTPRGARDVTFARGTDATILGVGQTNVYDVAYVLTQADFNAGGVANVATAMAPVMGGGLLTDTSDDGDDTDGNTVDDPTVLFLDSDAAVAVTKSVGIPRREAADRVVYSFTITVENTGNVTLTGLQIADDLRGFAAPSRVVSVTVPQAAGFAGTGGAAGAFDGVRQTGTLQGDVSLAPGDIGTVRFSVVLDPTQGYPAQDNVAEVTADQIADPATGTVAVPALPAANVRVVKVADTESALLGGTVGYTLTFENLNNSIETGLTFVDALPDGLSFTPGTARYDGADTPQPTIRGDLLEWSDITLAPRQTVTITLDARVTDSDGDLTNRAYVLDAGRAVISNRAEATVSRRPEAVFDCGDVIGKVFDDRNLNGYQDGVAPEDRSAITDQTYDEDKVQTQADQQSEGEPGLAGVRLATVNGTIITTDAYGRFSVPCAELPAAIGSNFTLKLDTRTLPTGYTVTTENPRTVRLTPGTVAKLNFGAAIANVVDIDLTGAAFVGSTADPVAALPAGVDALLEQIRDVPSAIRLSYYTDGEDRALARARLDAVESMIQSKWRGGGAYRLQIERSIQALE